MSRPSIHSPRSFEWDNASLYNTDSFAMNKRKRDASGQVGTRKDKTFLGINLSRRQQNTSTLRSFGYNTVQKQESPRTPLPDQSPMTLSATSSPSRSSAQQPQATLTRDTTSTGMSTLHRERNVTRPDPDDVLLSVREVQRATSDMAPAAYSLQQMQAEHEKYEEPASTPPPPMERDHSAKRSGNMNPVTFLKNLTLGKRGRNDEDEGMQNNTSASAWKKLRKRKKRSLLGGLSGLRTSLSPAAYSSPGLMSPPPVQPVPAPSTAFVRRPAASEYGEQVTTMQQSPSTFTQPVRSIVTSDRAGIRPHSIQDSNVPHGQPSSSTSSRQNGGTFNSQTQTPQIQIGNQPPSSQIFNSQINTSTHLAVPSDWSALFTADWPINQYPRQTQSAFSQPATGWDLQSQAQDPHTKLQQSHQPHPHDSVFNQVEPPSGINQFKRQPPTQPSLDVSARNEAAWFSQQQARVGQHSRATADGQRRQSEREEMQRHRRQQFQNEATVPEPLAEATYAAARAGALMRQHIPTPQRGQHSGLTGDYDKDQRLRHQPEFREAFAVRYGQRTLDFQTQVPTPLSTTYPSTYQGDFQQQQHGPSFTRDPATYEAHFPTSHMSGSDTEAQDPSTSQERSGGNSGNTTQHDSGPPAIAEERKLAQSAEHVAPTAAVPVSRTDVEEAEFETPTPGMSPARRTSQASGNFEQADEDEPKFDMMSTRVRTTASLPATPVGPNDPFSAPFFAQFELEFDETGNLIVIPSPTAASAAETLMAMSSTGDHVLANNTSPQPTSGTHFPAMSERSISPLDPADHTGRWSLVSMMSARTVREVDRNEMVVDEEPVIHTAVPTAINLLQQPAQIDWERFRSEFYHLRIDDSPISQRSGVG